MAQLKVIVPRLNKRKSPVEDTTDKSNIVGEVKEGFQFEGKADAANKLGSWYVDRDGFFYWGGGIAESVSTGVARTAILPAAPISFDASKMSWGHQFYDIPFIWNELKTMGRGVTVAVIDTGVDDKHPDLISNIHPLSKSFVGDEKDIIDINGHGTRMAGIIAGSGNHQVFGIAPEAKILVVKATLKKNGPDINRFTEAVNFVSSLPAVDIVSISYSFLDDPLFKKAIEDCLKAKKIVIGAIGNARDTDLPEDDDTFPACYNSGRKNNGEEVIAVGAFDSQKKISTFSNSNKHLSFLAPGEDIFTTNIGSATVKENGTSIATAFTAGCMALMISFCKLNNKASINCAQVMLNTCDDFGSEIGHDPKSGFGFINLRNAISKIK